MVSAVDSPLLSHVLLSHVLLSHVLLLPLVTCACIRSRVGTSAVSSKAEGARPPHRVSVTERRAVECVARGGVFFASPPAALTHALRPTPDAAVTHTLPCVCAEPCPGAARHDR
uniref:Secreted protein n=1 Tax=Knipowitschia caucasica TaxID=637954 RepID=A0AAV2KJH3_KNICA